MILLSEFSTSQILAEGEVEPNKGLASSCGDNARWCDAADELSTGCVYCARSRAYLTLVTNWKERRDHGGLAKNKFDQRELHSRETRLLHSGWYIKYENDGVRWMKGIEEESGKLLKKAAELSGCRAKDIVVGQQVDLNRQNELYCWASRRASPEESGYVTQRIAEYCRVRCVRNVLTYIFIPCHMTRNVN